MALADSGGIGTLALALPARVGHPGERFFEGPRPQDQASAVSRLGAPAAYDVIIMPVIMRRSSLQPETGHELAIWQMYKRHAVNIMGVMRHTMTYIDHG